jgi:hypothetical protein
MASVTKPCTSTSKSFHDNFQIGILSTCYEIYALSTEGKQQKYDTTSEISEKKKRAVI